jgi:hypothetical protein
MQKGDDPQERDRRVLRTIIFIMSTGLAMTAAGPFALSSAPTPLLKKLYLEQLRAEKTILARALFANGAGANGKTKSYVRRILSLNTKILQHFQKKP